MTEYILEVQNLTKNFAGIRALNQLNFGVLKGQIKGIIGPNGAGKTTLIKVITGIYPVDWKEARILFRGNDITGMQTYQIAQLGIAQTFQICNLFKNMTVIENVMAGRHLKGKSNFLTDGLGLLRNKQQEKNIFNFALNKLGFVDLASKAYEIAGRLPPGEQKLLEIARALAFEPEIIFLDEPAGGLNPSGSLRLQDIIFAIKRSGITIVLVEHNMDVLMSVSDEVIVLNFGEKIAEGPPHEIKNNPLVIKAYLG